VIVIGRVEVGNISGKKNRTFTVFITSSLAKSFLYVLFEKKNSVPVKVQGHVILCLFIIQMKCISSRTTLTVCLFSLQLVKWLEVEV